MRIPRLKARKLGRHWFCMVVPCGILAAVNPVAGAIALGATALLAWAALR